MHLRRSIRLARSGAENSLRWSHFQRFVRQRVMTSRSSTETSMEPIMQARMKPATLFPDASRPCSPSTRQPSRLGLLSRCKPRCARAINGCSMCVDMHSRTNTPTRRRAHLRWRRRGTVLHRRRTRGVALTNQSLGPRIAPTGTGRSLNEPQALRRTVSAALIIQIGLINFQPRQCDGQQVPRASGDSDGSPESSERTARCRGSSEVGRAVWPGES